MTFHPDRSTQNAPAGQAAVYWWNQTNSSWSQRGQNITSVIMFLPTKYGKTVVLSGDGSTLAVRRYTPSSVGTVSVFAWDSEGSAWVQRGTSLTGAASSDYYGFSMSLSWNGTVLAVGAYLTDSPGTNAGSAQVWTWNNQSAGGTWNWTKRGSDILGEAAGDNFGSDVSLSSDGSILAVGATGNDPTAALTDAGHVRVFRWWESSDGSSRY